MCIDTSIIGKPEYVTVFPKDKPSLTLEGYLYDEPIYSQVRALAPCYCYQHYTDGSRSTKVSFNEGPNKS